MSLQSLKGCTKICSRQFLILAEWRGMVSLISSMAANIYEVGMVPLSRERWQAVRRPAKWIQMGWNVVSVRPGRSRVGSVKDILHALVKLCVFPLRKCIDRIKAIEVKREVTM
jgi:hypothetical protein